MYQLHWLGLSFYLMAATPSQAFNRANASRPAFRPFARRGCQFVLAFSAAFMQMPREAIGAIASAKRKGEGQ